MPRKRESKSERFIRVAELRVNKALKALAAIGGCADIRSYEYTDDQIDKIFEALRIELDCAEARYRSGSGRRVIFKLTPEAREQEEVNGDR